MAETKLVAQRSQMQEAERFQLEMMATDPKSVGYTERNWKYLIESILDLDILSIRIALIPINKYETIFEYSDDLNSMAHQIKKQQKTPQLFDLIYEKFRKICIHFNYSLTRPTSNSDDVLIIDIADD